MNDHNTELPHLLLGKETEDKRGRVIEDNPSWLYLKGSPVVCNRWMEMAAVVAAINSSINALSESLEIGLIKQKLLGKLHGLGFLQRYPMVRSNNLLETAITNLITHNVSHCVTTLGYCKFGAS